MRKRVNKITLQVGGNTYQSKSGATLNTGGKKRSTEWTDQGTKTYGEEYVSGMLEATFAAIAGVDVEAINNWTDETITVGTDIDETWMADGAMTLEPVVLSKDGYKVKVEFNPARKI